MKISLIHPSRNRPDMAASASKKWVSSAGTKVEYILSIDFDDPEVDHYFNGVYGSKVISPNRSAVDAINNAAKVSTGDILVVMSDDFDCPENWALKIIEQTEGKRDWIAKTWDGIQKWIITLPIMDRTYYNRFGYIYHPDYLHMFCDTEITCVADLTGRKIDLDIPFVHNHYSTGKTVRDDLSIRADATWDHGEKLFIERSKRNFDLVNPPGRVTSQEYINWMRMKGVSVR